MFLKDCPRLMTDIRDAIIRRDGPSLKLAAHTLKGSAGVFQDRLLVDQALGMEIAGRDEQWEQAEMALPSLEDEAARLVEELSQFIRSTAPVTTIQSVTLGA